MSPTARSLFPSGSYSRAVVGVPAEEHGLAAVVAEPVLLGPLDVPALGVRGAHARLKVLYGGQVKGGGVRSWMIRVVQCHLSLNCTTLQSRPYPSLPLHHLLPIST